MSPRVDYAALYDGYWRRPDRADTFVDLEGLVGEILTAHGTGRMLDVGCGSGRLVQALLAQGVDAHGVDVAAVPIERGNRAVPGRFHRGSVLELPFADRHFDVVVSTGCLEHLDPADVPRALAELYRVARRGVYLRLATVADPERTWHRTVQPRAWWEDRLFAAGFRKHPRSLAVVPYAALEHDGATVTLVQERLSAQLLSRYPIERLLESRYLHMDMLRETGRRSDAHVARYQLAAEFVRPNDVVLDVACGLGYGAAVLAANSEAGKVLGVDLEQYAVDYAAAATTANWPQAEFRAGDATDLAFLPDRSIDLIVSFETLEHVPEPEAVLAEFHRVLKPSGRIVVSVPHLWVDETGRDPNPHHLHVYDWPKLRDQLARRFLPEAVWAQTAGGGMKLTAAPRRIQRAALADPTGTPAEWWLALAMKSPLDARVDDYEETSFPAPANGERPNVTAFGRDYDNPWLVKAMVVRGQRLIDDSLLLEVAAQVLQQHPVGDGSADAGAALCVEAYRVLSVPMTDAATVDACLADVDRYCAIAVDNPNARRWQVSLHYVAACLLRKSGRREAAAARFRRCAGLDALAYSPILGTKTVDALLQAGLIALADGDEAAAGRDFEQAITAAERLLHGDWSTFVGDRSRPLAFGLREATDLLDLAARAARGRLDVPMVERRPGKSFELLHFGLRPTIDLLERLLRQQQDHHVADIERIGRNEGSAQRELDELRPQLAAQMGELAAARATIAFQQQEIHNLQRLRGVKGALRALYDRLRGR